MNRILLIVAVAVSMVVGAAAEHELCEETISKPFKVTFSQKPCGWPHLSNEKFDHDTTVIDSVKHAGVWQTPITYFFVFTINPDIYR